MKRSCPECLEKLKELQETCHGCGYRFVLVPEEEDQKRYLSRPSLGGLLFTQAYTIGSRQYFWFILSIIPITFPVAFIAMAVFGRRWSWHTGGWRSFEQFRRRQSFLDVLGVLWILLLAVAVVWLVVSWR